MMELPKKRLGNVLVEAGLITPEQLAQALELQEAAGVRLGQVLVARGLVNDIDVAKTVAAQMGLSFIPDAELRPDPAVARLIPESLARRFLVLPLEERGDRLVLGMVDPFNVFAADEVRKIVGREITPVVVTERGLNKAVQQVYYLEGLPDAPPPARVEKKPGYRVREAAEDAPTVRLANSIIQRAIDERASDIHVEPQANGLRIRYRIDGVLQEALALPEAAHATLVSRLKIMAAMDISERRLPQDGRIQIKESDREVDLRVSTLPTIHGEKVVIRVLDKTRGVMQLAQLGFTPQTLERYLAAIKQPHGTVLVTGPTGSGKTTTLMATLQELNSPGKNIITVEDPVEYYIPGVNHVQINPKAGLGFASGLRAILRQDPNIIMVGEIRDRETAEIAIRAALTGHLVFSTIHTNDAAGALNRLVDMGVEPFLVASSVNAILSQRLVRLLCPRCKEPYVLAPGAAERAGLGLPDHPIRLFRAAGCPACNNTGYSGRVGLFEILTVTPAIRGLVTQKAVAGVIAGQAVAEGMRPLLEDSVDKAIRGLTTLEEVLRVGFAEKY